jgi:hypothetical protein
LEQWKPADDNLWWISILHLHRIVATSCFLLPDLSLSATSRIECENWTKTFYDSCLCYFKLSFYQFRKCETNAERNLWVSKSRYRKDMTKRYGLVKNLCEKAFFIKIVNGRFCNEALRISVDECVFMLEMLECFIQWRTHAIVYFCSIIFFRRFSFLDQWN